MKYLSEQEINFLKNTKYTLTVLQCNEWERCSFKNFEEAVSVANDKYEVDLLKLNEKLSDGIDSISLEFAAGYLFYILFTEDELNQMTPEEGLKFLQDFKYYGGWRKAEKIDASIAICDGIRLHQGQLVLTDEFGDGDVWYNDSGVS